MKRLRFLLAFLLMLPVLAWGQSSLPPCTAAETDRGARRHNCFGTVTLPSGHKYVGEFRDDKLHGQGTWTHPNGEKYVGEFRDGKGNGQGTWTHPNGEKYVGEFRDGKRHGQGTYTWPDGQKYVGEYRDGKRHGHGTYTFPDGAKYVGEYRDNNRHGQGTATTAKGNKYVGEFHEDKMHGQGTLYLPDGSSIFIGSFRNDKMDQGTLTNANGNKYVGEFKDNKLHGQGIYYRSDGSIAKSGQWADNALTQSYALDTNRFPFNSNVADVGKAERDRLTAEAELKSQQEIDRRLAAAAREWERANRFPVNAPVAYADEAERDRLAAELEAERKKRAEAEARQLAETRERERLAAEAKERDRLALEAERRRQQELEEKLAAETRERERLAAEAEAERKKRQELEARITAAERQPIQSKPLAAGRQERRVALVIGNSAYRINPLVNPVNDASDVASALRSLGFETVLVRDASIGQIREVTRKFADSVATSDVALIFYAGHGIEAKGRNYLIPITADIRHEYELEDQAYDAGRWLDMLENMRGSNRQRVNIVILDACRDNAFSRGWRAATRGLGRMDAPAGTFIAFATAPGKVAADGDRQRNSPFTKSLLKAIQEPNLPIELMFKEVRRLVLEETKGEQVPWDNSSLVGNFVFKR